MKKFIVLLVMCLATPATANANTAKMNELVYRIASSDHVIPSIKHSNPFIRRQSLCLALTIYHEARDSIPRDRWGVGHVVLNRVRHTNFGNTVCDVVAQKGQFSWTTNRISSLIPKYKDPEEKQSWEDAQRFAYLLVVDKEMIDPTHGATYFYSKHIRMPPWARGCDKKLIGGHFFVVKEEEKPYESVPRPRSKPKLRNMEVAQF